MRRGVESGMRGFQANKEEVISQRPTLVCVVDQQCMVVCMVGSFNVLVAVLCGKGRKSEQKCGKRKQEFAG